MSLLCACAVVLLATRCLAASRPPNIILIVADDLGHNDISLNGSPQIPTPNIDAIFKDGVTLDSYHAQPVCSPTRSSMLSGRHVIHTGIYMPFDGGVTNEALNTSFTLLPRYLKRAGGYKTALVGKWHIGANSRNATPVGRGFDQAYGYWSGAEDYETHSVTANKRVVYDMQDDLASDVSVNGTFSTRVFASKAEALIMAQGAAGSDAPPLFLYLAFQNVHWPLEAPADIVARFANTTGGNAGRGLVCAMAAFLDEAVGNVTRAITAAGLAENTIIVFVSDNGGPTHADESTFSNNYPLRGGKNTLWSGGTRVLGAVKGPGIAPGSILTSPVHATDWLATLVSAATGGKDFRQFAPPGEPAYEDGDGLDVWGTIVGKAAAPARDWLLLEAHNDGSEKALTHGNALIEWRAEGVLKYLLLGPEDPQIEDGWWPPDGQDAASTNYRVKCSWHGGGPRTGTASIPNLCTQTACLFNLTADPCEYFDIASDHPMIVKRMAERLATYHTVPPLVGSGCMPQVIGITGTQGPAFQFYPCDVPAPPAASPVAADGAPADAAETVPRSQKADAGVPNIIWLQADSIDGRLFDPTDTHMYGKLLIDAVRTNYLNFGVTFTRHFTNSPQCVPSRTSMVTSRYIHESWTPNNGQGLARSTRTGALDSSCVSIWSRAFCEATAERQNISSTFIDAVQEAGYRFAPFGRFDIGGGVNDDYPGTDGDGWHDGPELGILARGAAIEGAIDARGPRANTDAADADPFRADQVRAGAAKAWLLSDDPHGKAPFFFWCGLMIPHPPYDTNATWAAHVNASSPVDVPDQVPRNLTHPYDAFMSRAKHVWGEFPTYSDDDITLMRASYWGAVAEASELLREVLHAAETSGHLDNTIVIITSDHGEMSLEHRMDLKSSLHEPSIRVPLVIIPFNVPGMEHAAGKRVANITSHLDIWPTLAALTHAPLAAGVRGESLMRFLVDDPVPAPPRKDYAVVTYASNYAPCGSYAIRTGQWKLITYGHNFPWASFPPQLFDVDADPGELIDVAASNADTVAELMAVLEGELGGTGAVARIESELMADNLERFTEEWFSRCTGEELVAAFLRDFIGSTRDAVIERVTAWYGESPLNATGAGGACPRSRR